MDKSIKDRIVKTFLEAKHLPPGTIADVDILHDVGCHAIHSGRMGDCTCIPEVKLRQRVTDALSRYEKKNNRDHCPAWDSIHGKDE